MSSRGPSEVERGMSEPMSGAVVPSIPEIKPTAPRSGDRAPTSPVVSVRSLGKLYHVYARPQDRLKQALAARGQSLP